MKTKALLALAFASSLLTSQGLAGHMIAPPLEASVRTESARTWFADEPIGAVTFGVQFSEHATGGYIDSNTGLWSSPSRDAFLFLDSRYTLEDNEQVINSNGLTFRKLFRDQQIIVGGNAFWDIVTSPRGNDFNQLGLGVEVLTRWVDFRFNYYLPENDRYEVDRRSTRESSRTVSGEFESGGFVNRNVVETGRRRDFKRYEAALEGFNTEVGFLVPGLDRYAEVRVYGGYYRYDNPFGHNYEGFKARLEAHLLPGIIADVEYWDDTALMGGHWTAGARVSLPFSIYNLVTLRNPFEGIGEFFRPRQRVFEERMADMVIRSHRIQTTTSGDILTNDRRSETVTTVPIRPVTPPVSPGIVIPTE